MGETVASLDNFEVYPSILDGRNYIIFCNEVFWDILNADPHKLRAIHRRGQIKIADFKSRKARITSGEDAVGCECNKLYLTGWRANVSWVKNPVSYNGDPRLVRIFFVGPVFAHNLGVRNFVAAVNGDIFVSDDPESVSSLDALFFLAFRSLTYALAQASQFV